MQNRLSNYHNQVPVNFFFLMDSKTTHLVYVKILLILDMILLILILKNITRHFNNSIATSMNNQLYFYMYLFLFVLVILFIISFCDTIKASFLLFFVILNNLIHIFDLTLYILR